MDRRQIGIAAGIGAAIGAVIYFVVRRRTIAPPELPQPEFDHVEETGEETANRPFCCALEPEVCFATIEELEAYMVQKYPPQIVELNWASEPPFGPSELRIAYLTLQNPTSRIINYDCQLYLGLEKVNIYRGNLPIAPGDQGVIPFTIITPSVEGEYQVFIDIYIAGVLSGHYQAGSIQIIEYELLGV